MNRRSRLITGFLCVLIAIYSLSWYLLSQHMQGFLTQYMEIKQEDIKLLGFPLRIKLKIRNDQLDNLSFNLFSKKLSVNMKKAYFDNLGSSKAETLLKDMEYINISTKLDSYITLIKVILEKGNKLEPIDGFNLFSSIGVELKADVREPTWDIIAPISGRIELSIPGKRLYTNFGDILSDLPKNLILNGDYDEDMIPDNNGPEFMKKIAKSYPTKSKMQLKASLPNDKTINLAQQIGSDTQEDDALLDLIRSVKLEWAIDTESQDSISKTNIFMDNESAVNNIKITSDVSYKNGAIARAYTAFNGDDWAEIMSVIFHRYGTQLTDSNKLKFKLMGDLFSSNIQKGLSKDPNMLKNLDGVKTNCEISMVIPHKEGMNGMKYFMHLRDNRDNISIKLDGNASGEEAVDSTNGTLSLNNKSHGISQFIEVLRLASFAISKSVTTEDFKLSIDNYDKDIQAVEASLMSLSDNPTAIDGVANYSYQFKKSEMMNSKFSTTGKTFADLLLSFSVLFTPEQVQKDGPAPTTSVSK